jgi:predicted PurR-regulated permease PerM
VGVCFVTASQAFDLASKLPDYRQNIEAKLSSVEKGLFGLPLSEAKEGLEKLEKPPPGPSARDLVGTDRVILTRDVPPSRTAWETIKEVFGSAVAPLGAFLVVVVLTIFLLAYREDLRDRMIRLLSRGHIGLTTQAFDDASRRVSRYLVSALLVNTVYAVLIWVGLWAIGIPNALLWGVLAGLLRFVPYVGVWIGAALPFGVAFAVFDGWGHAGGVLLLMLAIDLLVGNLLEPLVYARRTGLSPLAVVVAALFWTWVWGIPGLLLAVPMTVCLAVAGRYVPGLGFLHVLLGDDPALGPEDRAYQRLVVLEPDAVRKIVEERLAENEPADEVFDAVLIGALRRAETDRHHGVLDETRARAVSEGVVEAADGVEVGLAGAGWSAPTEGPLVLCVPAGEPADRAACEVLARRLASRGVRVEVGSQDALSGEVAERVARGDVAVACVAAVPPFATTRVRYLVKRIRARSSTMRVLSIVWDPDADRVRVDAVFRDAGADMTAVTLLDACEGVRRLLADQAGEARPAGAAGTSAAGPAAGEPLGDEPPPGGGVAEVRRAS